MKTIACLSALLALGTLSQAAAQSSQSLKVLFWGGQSGIHNPQEQGNRFIAAMKTAGIQVDYTGAMDNSGINDANLAKYDAIVSYQQSGAPEITNAQVASLYRFVESGKGIIFTHMSLVAGAASDRYSKLIGGYFLDHGNGAYYGQPIVIDSNDLSHPAYAGTPAWTAWDETYVNAVYDGSHVLQRRGAQDKGPTDWTWVREQGKGRVYYTSWGHDANTWGHPGFMKQLEIALEYVTEPLRGGSSAIAPMLIFPKPEYALVRGDRTRSGLRFAWRGGATAFGIDGRGTPVSGNAWRAK
jgi:type 1 glutamine amidotransferase